MDIPPTLLMAASDDWIGEHELNKLFAEDYEQQVGFLHALRKEGITSQPSRKRPAATTHSGALRGGAADKLKYGF